MVPYHISASSPKLSILKLKKNICVHQQAKRDKVYFRKQVVRGEALEALQPENMEPDRAWMGVEYSSVGLRVCTDNLLSALRDYDEDHLSIKSLNFKHT